MIIQICNTVAAYLASLILETKLGRLTISRIFDSSLIFEKIIDVI